VEVQRYSFLLLALDEDDWPISHPGRLSVKEKALSAY
jgi:hypothetical protein